MAKQTSSQKGAAIGDFLSERKTTSFKPPKSLAECADLLYKIREARYALNKEVKTLEEKELVLREYLIDNLPKSSATGISGKVATAKVELKVVPVVEDWDKYYEYIVKNRKKGAFALLQRRPNASAIEDIWAAGQTVPGTSRMQVPVISLTKR